MQLDLKLDRAVVKHRQYRFIPSPIRFKMMHSVGSVLFQFKRIPRWKVFRCSGWICWWTRLPRSRWRPRSRQTTCWTGSRMGAPNRSYPRSCSSTFSHTRHTSSSSFSRSSLSVSLILQKLVSYLYCSIERSFCFTCSRTTEIFIWGPKCGLPYIGVTVLYL